MWLCLIVAIFYSVLNAKCDSFDKVNASKTSEFNETNMQSDNISLVEENSQTIAERASALLDICDDGKIDVALQTIDDTIYIFKRLGFLIVDLDGGSKANKSYVTASTWSDFNSSLELAFTITDPYNFRYGSSILLSKNTLYEFNNTRFTSIISTQYWDRRLDLHLKPFFFYGDSIFAFYDDHQNYPPFNIFSGKFFYFLDFHNLEQPDIVSYKSVDNLPSYFAYVNQIVPLKDDRWLVFLSYASYGTYCMVYNVSTTKVFTCEEKNLNELIDCPVFNQTLMKGNWIIWIWKFSSLNQDSVIFSIKGFFIASLYGLCILYVLTYFNYIESKVKSKSKLKSSD